MEKIQSTQLLDLITQAFREHLGKYSAFSNTSLCYYGVEVVIPAFTITTYSRSEQKLEVTISTVIGEVKDDLGQPLEATTLKVAPLVKFGGKKPSNVGKYGDNKGVAGTAEPSEVRG